MMAYNSCVTAGEYMWLILLLVADNADLSRDIEVKSYNFRQFVLLYGPAKCYMVCILFCVITNYYYFFFIPSGINIPTPEG